MRHNKFKIAETESAITIQWADALIEDSNYEGIIDTNCFALDWHISIYSDVQDRILKESSLSNSIREVVLSRLPKQTGETYRLDVLVNELLKYRGLIEAFLLKEGYIQIIDKERKWILTNRGFLAKELGGHNKYKRYRKSEIGLIINQGLINKLLIGATALAAIMPFLAAWLFTAKVYNTNVLPKQNLEVRIDSLYLQQLVDDVIQKKLSTQQREKPIAKPQPK